jgi:hypothetical protein
MYTLYSLTANEGPVRIQYKCLVPVYVFPERQLCNVHCCAASLFPKLNSNVLSPISYTDIYVPESYIGTFQISVDFYYAPVGGRGGLEKGKVLERGG